MIKEFTSKLSAALCRIRSGRLQILPISVAQLRDLSDSNLLLGPSTLKEWNVSFLKYFRYCFEHSPDVRTHAPNLVILLTTKPSRGHMEVWTMARQILSRYKLLVAEETHNPQMEHWADIFITLKMLSLRMIGNQCDPAALREKIRVYNEDMAQTAALNKLPYKVQVR
jgi:hypothetical protein